MEKNPAAERIQDDCVPTFPDADIVCKDCEFRLKTGFNNYQNAYCDIFSRDIGSKPNEILFNHAKCKYYMKEED